MLLEFKIGKFLVKPSQCTICEDNKPEQRLEPKAMALLVALVEAKGELISRTVLFERIWPDQIVTDYALNTLISSLRKSLGDQADSPLYIETRPKLGYRLVCKIKITSKSNNNGNKQQPLKSRNWVFLTGLIIIGIVAITVFVTNNQQEVLESSNSSLVNSKNNPTLKNPSKIKAEPEEVIQYKYILRVNISPDFSVMNEAGKPICVGADSDFVAKLVYTNQEWSLTYRKWTLYSDFYDIDLNHHGQNLSGLKETHYVEHRHPYGTVKENMTVTFDEAEDFTGASKWTVYGSEDKVLCTGSSLFIANKL